MLNNVRNIKILNIILGALKRRIKLNLFKYNKKMINKLNITKEDFGQFILLKIINSKFNLDIKDIDIKELNLENKNLDNDIIEYLSKIKFNKLKVIHLEKNKISDIKQLEKVKFEKLEYLYLRENNISNIDILKKLTFKELNLNYNDISDIKVLEKVKFEKLEKLNLIDNKIDKNKYSSIINNLKFNK